ncbi:kinase-like protein [Hypoxylon sp. FL1857]|nr:kinase-like protein [Hypoxylon sp. FL1857]
MIPLDQRLDNLEQIMRTNTRAPVVLGDNRFKRAQAAWKQVRNIFALKGNGRLQYRRVLGFGGFGMVQLWRIKNDFGPSREVAVKFPLKHASRPLAEEIGREIEWMSRAFKNNEHFTQLVDLPSNTQLSAQRLYNNSRAELPILVMEVMSKGTLHDLISEINAARQFKRRNPHSSNLFKLGYVPNRLLWRMFLCLARAAVGMAYIPSKAQQEGHRPIREVINPQNRIPEPEPAQIVHFDLDPQNVLVGDLGPQDAEHSVNVKLKVADFGCMLIWNNDATEEQRRWAIRRGKVGWFAPEQRYPDHGIDQYIGYPLNVWAIGLIMFNLLTLRHPREEWWEPQSRYFKRSPDQAAGESIDTWGWILLENAFGSPLDPFIQAYDLDLRMLIARCLAHQPSDRPALDELLATIQLGIQNSDRNSLQRGGAAAAQNDDPDDLSVFDIVQPEEDNEILEKFYYDYLLEPAVRDDPYAPYWDT